MVRNRALVLVGSLVICVGLVVALKPFDTSISVTTPGGTAVYGSSDCGVPVRAMFRSQSDDSGWFAYAPDTRVVASDGLGCRTPALQRAGLGALAMIVGAAVVVAGVRRRKTEPIVLG